MDKIKLMIIEGKKFSQVMHEGEFCCMSEDAIVSYEKFKTLCSILKKDYRTLLI